MLLYNQNILALSGYLVMWGSEVKTKPVEVQIFFHLNGVFQQGEEVTEVYL